MVVSGTIISAETKQKLQNKLQLLNLIKGRATENLSPDDDYRFELMYNRAQHTISESDLGKNKFYKYNGLEVGHETVTNWTQLLLYLWRHCP